MLNYFNSDILATDMFFFCPILSDTLYTLRKACQGFMLTFGRGNGSKERITKLSGPDRAQLFVTTDYDNLELKCT